LEEEVVAEQTAETVESVSPVGGVAHVTHAESHNPGRPISWTGTGITIVGFVIGGAAMIPSPHWVLFWVGAAVAIVGLLILTFSKAINVDWY
jgi:hypothetical protein